MIVHVADAVENCQQQLDPHISLQRSPCLLCRNRMRYNTCLYGHADENSLDGMEQLSRCKHVTFLELARIPSEISEENHSAIERYIGYKRYGRKKM